jgi:hypothetical protein
MVDAATLHLRHWIEFSQKHTGLQQFGQKDDESTFGGKTGCTHTILQRLVLAHTGHLYSPDEISKIATYPWPKDNPHMRGMYSGGSDDEVGKVIRHFGLPYRLHSGGDWGDLIAAVKLGPVMVGIRYGYWPEMRGYRYNGVLANGKPGGFAKRNGKTQLSGAESIYHMILIFGRRTVSTGGVRVYANEPNHGSAARPEKPDYDRVVSSDAHRAFDQYSSTGRKSVLWVPTRKFEPIASTR